MSEPQKYPPGWDDKRVRGLIEHYDRLSEDEAAAEDQAGRAVISVPEELLPAIRQLLATHKSA